MATTTSRRRNGSPIFRIIALLLPAVYCSWRAFWYTLQMTTWPVTILESDHRDHYLLQVVPLRPFLVDTVVPNKAKDHRSLDVAKIHQTWNILNDETETETECFGFNSRRWLDGPRLGNANIADGMNLNHTMLMSTLLTTTTTILQQQAFCGPQSPFQSISVSTPNTDNADRQQEQQQQQRLWTTRLLYLAVHWHQHSPALLEAEYRRANANPYCQQLFLKKGIGSFDYECPTAKFLVVAFSKNGIGANMRLVAVPALMAGLATQRVVLFVNDALVGPDFVRQPWTLASCQRRRDAQCFFLPSSPCVLTEQELAQAYQLQRGDRRRLFRYGNLPEDHVQDRVLLMHLGSLRPQREPENLRHALFQLSLNVLERIVAQVPTFHDVDSPMNSATTEEVLHHAAQDILRVQEDGRPTTETGNATFSYYGVNSSIFQSLLLYALRPNPWAVNEMDAILKEMFPPDFDPHNTIGLPIRASDKCGVESECLPFTEYMAAAQYLWQSERSRFSESKGIDVNIVVTSESREVLRQEQRYASAMQNSNPSLAHPRFIWNHLDVAQDTGYLEEVLGSSGDKANALNSTADEMMLSALSSLRAQLQTEVTLGNCCSNFHLLLKDLIDQGCGATETSHFQCLQDHEDLAYHICCSWDQSPRCQMRRQRHQQSQLQS